jgi:peptide deformylase
MIRDIRTLPDPILTRPSHRVRKQRIDFIREVSKDLLDTVKDHQGLGLAAPQIGIGLRIIAVDLNPPGGKLYAVFVNPEITLLGAEKEIAIEGCLSIPGMSAQIERSTVAYIKWDGGNRHYTGLVARILQHEIDHLNGILLYDRSVV